MKRAHVWVMGGAIVLAILVLTATRAAGFAPDAAFRKFAVKEIDTALAEAGATSKQRADIAAAFGPALDAMEAERQLTRTEPTQALALFVADRLDEKQLSTLRSAHEAASRAAEVSLNEALMRAHQLLQPEQRRAVAAQLRRKKPLPPVSNFGPLRKLVRAFIAQAPGSARLTPQQEKELVKTIDGLIQQAIDHHKTAEEEFQRAAIVFDGARVDAAEMSARLAKDQKNESAFNEAVLDAFRTVHALLTPEQRRALVARLPIKLSAGGRP